MLVCVCVHIHRVQQLEDENDEMKLNVCRLKSQTEKLDQVMFYLFIYIIIVFQHGLKFWLVLL